MPGCLITLAKEIHFHMLEELVANPEMILLSSEEEVSPALLMVALSRVHKTVGWRVLRYLMVVEASVTYFNNSSHISRSISFFAYSFKNTSLICLSSPTIIFINILISIKYYFLLPSHQLDPVFSLSSLTHIELDGF
jgi:hypothetical protein